MLTSTLLLMIFLCLSLSIEIDNLFVTPLPIQEGRGYTFNSQNLSKKSCRQRWYWWYFFACHFQSKLIIFLWTLYPFKRVEGALKNSEQDLSRKCWRQRCFQMLFLCWSLSIKIVRSFSWPLYPFKRAEGTPLGDKTCCWGWRVSGHYYYSISDCIVGLKMIEIVINLWELWWPSLHSFLRP
jgi:hypothetical protein